MRSSTAKKQFDPDQNYQLPHPDLVCIPPSLMEDTRATLSLYMSLWEQLGDAAVKLAGNLRELEAAGGCPEDLAKALSWAASLYLQSGAQNPEGRGVGGWKASTTTIDRSIDIEREHSSSSTGVVKGDAAAEISVALVHYLQEIGYVGAKEDVDKYGANQVQAAIDYAKTRKISGIQGMARYIRWALAKGIVSESPPNPISKYKRGKFGHVVQT